MIILAILVARSAGAEPVISEVLYNPKGSDSGYEFIELYNNLNQTIEIGGWKIEGAGTEFEEKLTIPEGETIPAKTHYLIGEKYIET